MIITCEACNTSFNLDDKMLKPTGSKVRCSVCANVFTAFPDPAPAHEPHRPPEEPEPVQPAPADDMTSDASASTAAIASAAESTDTGEAAAPSPETDAVEAENGDLSTEAPELDVKLEDKPEAAADTEIEDAVSDALEENGGRFPEPGIEPDDGDATMIANLDDDDFNLDIAPDGVDENGTATVIASLDDDLDLDGDDQPEIAETIIADLDQEDFDLDLPSDTDGDLEDNATIIANLDDETFDLDDDFSLEPADADASMASEAPSGPESMEDLDDLNLTLDMDEIDDSPQEEMAESESTDDEIDDLSLDFDLEADAEPAQAIPDTDATDASDDDMELSLDLEDAGSDADQPAAKAPVLEDDLDLSSLEGLLDDDETDDADTATMVADEPEDVELSLDMDDDHSVADADAGDASDEVLEDLAFDLDGEAKAEDTGLEDADDDEQEIDLSEIEKMLEEPESESAKFSSVPDQDLDLDIEASLETEKWMSESGEEDQLVMDEELDLSELEQALDDIDMDAADDTPEDAELELDIDEGDQMGTPTETVAVDSELDFDLSDFEDKPSPQSAAEAAAGESADMELEFEVEEDDKVAQTLEDEGLEETVAIPEPEAEAAAAVPPDIAKSADAAPAPKPQPAKKGISKSLVFFLIVAILGGGGYGTYYLLNQNGIEIPFLSDYLKPKVNDPGNLKLTTYDINSKFIENANAGKLFVITGKVKNGYGENRGMVTLSGKIFSTGKVLANQERVYSGNIMSDLELANLELDKIKNRLSNRLGDNRSNVKIEPGQSIPFMVVFSDLPEDLEEFTIEVTGSTSLK